ncbi:MAG: hypothetical protein ACO2ZM_04675 [Francisellaceae bacterium]
MNKKYIAQILCFFMISLSFGFAQSTSQKNHILAKEKSSLVNLQSTDSTVESSPVSQFNDHLASSQFSISPISGAVSAGYIVDKVNDLYGYGISLPIGVTYQSGNKSSIYLSDGQDSSWDLSFPSVSVTTIPGSIVDKVVTVKINGITFTINPKYVDISSNDTITLKGLPFSTENGENMPNDFFIYSHVDGNKEAPDYQKIKMAYTPSGSIEISTSNGTIYTLKQQNWQLNSKAYLLSSISTPLQGEGKVFGLGDVARQTINLAYLSNQGQSSITIFDTTFTNGQITNTSGTLARIVLYYDPTDGGVSYLNSMEISTPNYSNNSNNLSNSTSFSFKKIDSGPDKAQIISITSPDGRTTRYSYITEGDYNLISNIEGPTESQINISYVKQSYEQGVEDISSDGDTSDKNIQVVAYVASKVVFDDAQGNVLKQVNYDIAANDKNTFMGPNLYQYDPNYNYDIQDDGTTTPMPLQSYWLDPLFRVDSTNNTKGKPDASVADKVASQTFTNSVLVTIPGRQPILTTTTYDALGRPTIETESIVYNSPTSPFQYLKKTYQYAVKVSDIGPITDPNTVYHSFDELPMSYNKPSLVTVDQTTLPYALEGSTLPDTGNSGKTYETQTSYQYNQYGQISFKLDKTLNLFQKVTYSSPNANYPYQRTPLSVENISGYYPDYVKDGQGFYKKITYSLKSIKQDNKGYQFTLPATSETGYTKMQNGVETNYPQLTNTFGYSEQDPILHVSKTSQLGEYSTLSKEIENVKQGITQNYDSTNGLLTVTTTTSGKSESGEDGVTSTTKVLNRYGLLVSGSNSQKQSYALTYDNLGRIVQASNTSNPDFHITKSYQYVNLGNGRAVIVTDPFGWKLKTVYNSFGKVSATYMATPSAPDTWYEMSSYTYKGNQLFTKVVYKYGLDSQLLNKLTTYYTYDVLGNLAITRNYSSTNGPTNLSTAVLQIQGVHASVSFSFKENKVYGDITVIQYDPYTGKTTSKATYNPSLVFNSDSSENISEQIIKSESDSNVPNLFAPLFTLNSDGNYTLSDRYIAKTTYTYDHLLRETSEKVYLSGSNEEPGSSKVTKEMTYNTNTGMLASITAENSPKN